MRIVIDMQGAQTKSRFRGIGRYTMLFAKAVVRNRGDHEIILALNSLLSDAIESIRAEFEGILPQENIRVWNALGPIQEIHPDNDARRRAAELLREAFFASLRPSVIHISSLFEGYHDDAVTSIGSFDEITPVSVSLYDLIPLLNKDHYIKPYPRYAKYYQRKVDQLKTALNCFAISESSRQEGLECLSVPENRIVNVSAAIDNCFQLLQISDTESAYIRQKFGLTRPFILYTGGDDKRKNLPRLIQAYAALPAPLRKEHQLLLVGKILDTTAKQLLHLANSVGIHSNELSFAGYVNDDDLVKLYNLCKLFVFPSWHEGFGLPILESMSCGAATICSNASSLPEVIGLEEAMFDPFDVASISAKMAQALNDKVFHEKLRNNGLQQIKKFSWNETARRAIEAWEKIENKKLKQHEIRLSSNRKPKLAFVSPLSLDGTNCAELLPALAKFYDIEIIVAQDDSEDQCLKTVRDIDWLKEHFSDFDRILYQIGNSSVYHRILPLLQDMPGVVLLEDFFLGKLLEWKERNGTPAYWRNALYLGHGYPAVIKQHSNPKAAISDYPASFDIICKAIGVISHSRYQKNLALQWYGKKNISDHWISIPIACPPAELCRNKSSRKKIGFCEDDFIVCSFGNIGPNRLSHRLLESWFDSLLCKNKQCHLIFVGEKCNNDYSLFFSRSINTACNIHITDSKSPETVMQYMLIADIAVQLYNELENDIYVLKCMSYSLPCIVNAHGSMVELDQKAVWMLPDQFDDTALINAIEILWKETEQRYMLGENAYTAITKIHNPNQCAKRYTEAIEHYYLYQKDYTQTLVNKIAEQNNSVRNDLELRKLAVAIDRTFSFPTSCQCIFLDVSVTAVDDYKTGIQRVVRAVMRELLENRPQGYRIEPVRFTREGGFWHYRRVPDFTLRSFDCPVDIVKEETVEPSAGDIIILLDFAIGFVLNGVESGVYREYRNRGVRIYTIVYDLLPIMMPNVFPAHAAQEHKKWIEAISNLDGAICISKDVADELSAWYAKDKSSLDDKKKFHIGWFHLGGDVINSIPTSGIPEDAEMLLHRLKSRPSFLMVGTIEPRKGHRQVLDAFEYLWGEGNDCNLVIVGKKGWMVESLVESLSLHIELGHHLFWLKNISDEYLEKVYESSSCLIAASYGEGFGLPLIEAAQHKLPILARDIPIFREVAGEYAYYFRASNGIELAKTINDWLRLHSEKRVPLSVNMPYLTWEQSVKQLLNNFLAY